MLARPWFVLAIQNNTPAVDVFDETVLPAEFKISVTEIKIDKTAIKEAIKAGREIQGARMVNGTRLAIR